MLQHMPIAASAITAVASQPRTFINGVIVKTPMIALRVEMTIITAITGTATTPFTTAAQKSALIGLSA